MFENVFKLLKIKNKILYIFDTRGEWGVCTFEYFMRFLTLSSAPSYSSAVTIITNVMSTPPRTQKSRIRFTIYFSTLAVKLKYNNN